MFCKADRNTTASEFTGHGLSLHCNGMQQCAALCCNQFVRCSVMSVKFNSPASSVSTSGWWNRTGGFPVTNLRSVPALGQGFMRSPASGDDLAQFLTWTMPAAKRVMGERRVEGKTKVPGTVVLGFCAWTATGLEDRLQGEPLGHAIHSRPTTRGRAAFLPRKRESTKEQSRGGSPAKSAAFRVFLLSRFRGEVPRRVRETHQPQSWCVARTLRRLAGQIRRLSRFRFSRKWPKNRA